MPVFKANLDEQLCCLSSILVFLTPLLQVIHLFNNTACKLKLVLLNQALVFAVIKGEQLGEVERQAADNATIAENALNVAQESGKIAKTAAMIKVNESAKKEDEAARSRG